MAKIGDQDYPADMSPEEARQAIETLVNEFGGKAGSEEAFAQSIGHKSTNSGTYLRKRADMRKFGLMKPRSVEATEFGIEAANPRDREHEREILFEMLQNISLLSEIYDTLNGTEPDDLWRILTEITEAEPKAAQEAEGKIEDLYLKLIEYEPDKEKDQDLHSGDEREQSTGDSTSQTKQVPTESTIESTQEGSSGVFVRVGNDELKLEEVSDSNIELAQQFLESKKGADANHVQMTFSP